MISFDKITGLFELDDRIVLYRFKSLDHAYYDVFTKEGIRLASHYATGLKPVGVLQNQLYAFRENTVNEDWDIKLVILDL